MFRSRFSLLLLPTLLVLVACDGGDSSPDGGVDLNQSECEAALEDCEATGDGDGDGDGDGPPDGGQGDGDGDGDARVLFATESHESEVAFGWIAAGQPSQERLTEVVNLGATVISLRYQSEETFDEQAHVEGLGGTFIRYPTMGSDYQTVSFREGMYDLYDEQVELGVPVYLHCASSNRVGASWALYHGERLGYSDEEALQIGIDAGLSSLQSMVQEILASN